MVTVSDSSLRQNAYETLYDNIVLSCAGLLGSTVTVTAAFISGSTGNNPPLPQVVIHSPEVDYYDFSFNRANSTKEVRLLVDVYTRKAKDKDVIVDAIMNSISTTNFAGLSLVGSNESDALSNVDDNKLHLKSVAITYLRR
jgi:hypothetical protein